MLLEEEFGRVKGHFGPINTIAFHPDGKSYCSGKYSGKVISGTTWLNSGWKNELLDDIFIIYGIVFSCSTYLIDIQIIFYRGSA